MELSQEGLVSVPSSWWGGGAWGLRPISPARALASTTPLPPSRKWAVSSHLVQPWGPGRPDVLSCQAICGAPEETQVNPRAVSSALLCGLWCEHLPERT